VCDGFAESTRARCWSSRKIGICETPVVYWSRRARFVYPAKMIASLIRPLTAPENASCWFPSRSPSTIVVPPNTAWPKLFCP
jgi:hypothetical protein